MMMDASWSINISSIRRRELGESLLIMEAERYYPILGAFVGRTAAVAEACGWSPTLPARLPQFKSGIDKSSLEDTLEEGCLNLPLQTTR